MKIKFGKQSLIDLGRLGIENMEITENNFLVSRLSGVAQYHKMYPGRKRILTGKWTPHELQILDEIWNDISG